MITIALAEDHEKIRGGILKILTLLPGYRVTIESVNGFCLLTKLNAIKHLPDIAVIDIEMPVMDGLSVTNYLSNQYPKIKVLAVSYHKHPAIVQDMFYAGAKGYMLKENIAPGLLAEAFTTILSGNYFVDNCMENKTSLLAATKNRNTETGSANPELTEKEKIFLQLTATNISYDQIAVLMHVAKESVYNYQKSLKEKLGLGNQQELMLYAIQHGIAKVARYNSYPRRRRFYKQVS